MSPAGCTLHAPSRIGLPHSKDVLFCRHGTNPIHPGQRRGEPGSPAAIRFTFQELPAGDPPGAHADYGHPGHP